MERQKPYPESSNQAMVFAEPRRNMTDWATADKELNDAFPVAVIEGLDVKAPLDKHAAAIQAKK